MSDILKLLLFSTWESLYMVFFSVAIAAFFGIPLGILLFVTDNEQVLENGILNATLSWIVNIFRSTFCNTDDYSFAFYPISVRKAIGTTAAIVLPIHSGHTVSGQIN